MLPGPKLIEPLVDFFLNRRDVLKEKKPWHGKIYKNTNTVVIAFVRVSL